MMGIIFSIAPTWSRLRSKITRRQIPLAKFSIEQFEISPGLEVETHPALALPDEFERVKGTRAYTSLGEQSTIVKGGLHYHLPTIAYRHRNALLADGTIYVGGAFERVASFRPRPILLDQAHEYSEAMICADAGSDLFFGRWLCDSLAKEILASELDLPPINQAHPKRVHEDGYRTLLSLEANLPNVARIENLLLVDDRGYNEDHVRRFKQLRARLRARSNSTTSKLIYLGRGQIAVSGRGIHNELEVETALRSLGFIIIQPESMAPREIYEALKDARIVVAVEGSALAHAQLSMPEGSAMIAIQPSNRFSTAHKAVAEAAGMRFGYVVADADQSGLMVDVYRLCRTIELVASAVL